MSLNLTPAMLEGAYEFLRTTPPFAGWRLPHADNVEFVVARTKRWQGLYSVYKHKRGAALEHIICISGTRVGHTATLINLMAHEMLHLWQEIRRTAHHSSQHNAEFYRMTKLVCRHHGWDEKNFTP